MHGQQLHPLARLGHVAGVGLARQQLQPLEQDLEISWRLLGHGKEQRVHVFAGAGAEEIDVSPAGDKRLSD